MIGDKEVNSMGYARILKDNDGKPSGYRECDGYTKDDDRVYYCQVTVKRAIPQSFTVLRDGYACDDQHVFWGNCLLHVDRDSFNVLEDGYAEDKYHSIHGIVVTKKKGV